MGNLLMHFMLFPNLLTGNVLGVKLCLSSYMKDQKILSDFAPPRRADCPKTKPLCLPQRLEGSKKSILEVFILESSRLRGKPNVFGQSACPGKRVSQNSNFNTENQRIRGTEAKTK